MPSIETSITKYLLTGVLLVASVAGFIIDRFIHQQFNAQFNKTLEIKAWTLATLNDQKFGKVEFDFADEMMPEFEAVENPEYFQLWLDNGDMLERSRSLGDSDLPWVSVKLGETLFQDIQLASGQPGRLVAIHFTPQLDDDDEDEAEEHRQIIEYNQIHPLKTVTLMLARSRVDLIENLYLNRAVIALSIISMLLLISLVIRYAIKKGLSPLKVLSEQVQNIDDQSLDTKLNTQGVQTELSLITSQLNNLLERLNEAFLREKRFSSNVAHELRTPIAELMALSDVGKACVDSPDLVLQFFDDAKHISQNMSLLVETLLSLAHSESDKVRINNTAFNLHESIQSCVKRVDSGICKDAVIEWESQTDKLLQIYCDWDKWNQIINNLVFNACKYCSPGCTVSIRSSIKGALVSLSISNPTEDLEREDLAHLSEYFWRKDAARSGGTHVGLGLTLVATLCQLLGIRLSFELSEDKLFTVTLDNIPTRADK